MLEYIKIILISFISSVFAPVSVSSSSHFAFLNSVLDLTKDKNEAAVYFSIISLTFSLTAIFFVRKIYLKGFSSLKKSSKIKGVKVYKNMMLGVLISAVTALLTFIPVSKTKLLSDLFFDYLFDSNILISAFCCVSSGLILLVALWYSNSRKAAEKKSASIGDVVRMSIYQIPAFLFPGLSHISLSAASLTVGGVDERVIFRDILIYLAPSTLVVSVGRLIRSLIAVSGIDVVSVLICTVGAVVGSIIMFNIVRNLNIKKTFLFFSIYSVIFGLAIGIFTFI